MSHMPEEPVHIYLIPVHATKDQVLIQGITNFINVVYEQAETGIFNEKHSRTNSEEVKALITAQTLAMATTASMGSVILLDDIRGIIRVAMLSPTVGTLGTLCARERSRKTGVGKRLVEFAEHHCRKQGATVMQLELVIPTTYELPLKVWIQAWYERMGYIPIADEDFLLKLPQLAPNVITPVVFRIFQKRF